MENNTWDQIREVVTSFMKDSDLKINLNYYENVLISLDGIDRNISITGRINKKNESCLNEFRENLCDALAEKLGNEIANKFISEHFNVEIGICEGDRFKSFDAFDLDGKKVEINHKSGQVLLLDIWATWCKFCQEPMQENVDTFYKNKDSILKDRNISIFGISCDEKNLEWKNHLIQKNWNVIPQFIKSNIRESLGLQGIPKIIIVNKKGDVAYVGHPKKILIEESLINLSEEKNLIKVYQDNFDANPWLNNLNIREKMKLLTDINSKLKESGVINGSFNLKIKFELDKDEVKAVNNIPLFYGRVTQFEYDSMQSLSSQLVKSHNLNGFEFNTEIMQLCEDLDF